MMNEPTITMTGNMANDPELRFTHSGTPVASFTVATNPRIRGGDGEWTDGTAVFLRIIAWRDPVMVTGRFRQSEWETKEGEKRRGDEIHADAVGVPLDRRTVRLVKVTRERSESATESGQ
jgi:single-strand DNA-binding protein